MQMVGKTQSASRLEGDDRYELHIWPSDPEAKIRGLGGLAPAKRRLVLRIDYLLGVAAAAGFRATLPFWQRGRYRDGVTRRG